MSPESPAGLSDSTNVVIGSGRSPATPPAKAFSKWEKQELEARAIMKVREANRRKEAEKEKEREKERDKERERERLEKAEKERKEKEKERQAKAADVTSAPAISVMAPSAGSTPTPSITTTKTTMMGGAVDFFARPTKPPELSSSGAPTAPTIADI